MPNSRLRRVRPWLIGLGLVALACSSWWLRSPLIRYFCPPLPTAPAPAPDLARVPRTPPPPALPPALLPVRAATAERPAQAWERLLAADGSPREDLLAASDLLNTYLQAVPPARRPGLGFNEDLARALSNRAELGDSALPPDHPALRDGQLLDRWGTPWQLHPLAHDVVQLRSAGPDRLLYSADDLVYPPDPPVRTDTTEDPAPAP